MLKKSINTAFSIIIKTEQITERMTDSLMVSQNLMILFNSSLQFIYRKTKSFQDNRKLFLYLLSFKRNKLLEIESSFPNSSLLN